MTPLESEVGKKVRSTSGWVFFMCLRRVFESLANSRLSTNSLIVEMSLSPSTEVIINFNLVDNSADDIYSLIKEFLKDFEKKEWENTLRKKKTFPINASNNIFCQNRIALPNYFIKKYKKLMY